MPANAGASVFLTLHLARRVSIREVASCGPCLSLLLHARSSSSCLERDFMFLGDFTEFWMGSHALCSDHSQAK